MPVTFRLSVSRPRNLPTVSRQGAQTVIYIEVADFMLREENGTYALEVALDISILDLSGKALFEQADVVAFGRVFKSKLHDL